MEGSIAQGLSGRVEAAIRRTLGDSADEFDAPEWNVMEYVNSHFGSEAALGGAGPTLSRLASEIGALDASILETVRAQSSAGARAGRDLAAARDAIGDLAAQIAGIRAQADASEALVANICKDIRQLDVAKSHLTNTIRTLGRLKELSSLIDELRRCSETRNYRDAAASFEPAICLLKQFSEYRDMPKVSEIASNLEKLRDQFRYYIKDDFDILVDSVTPRTAPVPEARGAGAAPKVLVLTATGDLAAPGSGEDGDEEPRPLSAANIDTLKAAVLVMDALGAKDRRELISMFLNKQMRTYDGAFRRGTELGDTLEALERRFAWCRKGLVALETQFDKVFPPAWAMSLRFVLEFCDATRNALQRILAVQDVSVPETGQAIVRALMVTQVFEREMSARFEKRHHTKSSVTAVGHGAAGVAETSGDSADDEDDDNVPVYNARGELVDKRTAEYVKLKYARRRAAGERKKEEAERAAAAGAQREWIASLTGQDVNTMMPAQHQAEEEAAHLPRICTPGKAGIISIVFEPYMGAYVRFERGRIDKAVGNAIAECYNAAKRCRDLGIGSTMVPLFAEFKNAMEGYHSTLTAYLPRARVPAPEKSFPGDYYDVTDTSGVADCERTALIINTAEYCGEKIPALVEKIRESIDAANQSSIDMESVADEFMTLQAKGIITLGGVVACMLDSTLHALTKHAWEKITDVGDQSNFVTETGNILKSVMPRLRAKLNEAAFRSFCDKFARAYILRLSNAILRCSKVSEVGAQQLLMDMQALKSILLAAPSLRPESNVKFSVGMDDDLDDELSLAAAGAEAPAVYVKAIKRDLLKLEMLCKILATPKDHLADALKTFWPEASEEDVERVMTMKGMNKKDQNIVLVSIGLAKPNTGGAASFAATSMAAMAMAGGKGADTRNMLGRMGKLFKPGVGGSSQPSPSASAGAGAAGGRK